MGKIVEKTKKKKKGRPSLLDLQKRTLKQQQLQQQQQTQIPNNLALNSSLNYNSATPQSLRRSTRRNPTTTTTPSSSQNDDEQEEEEEEEGNDVVVELNGNNKNKTKKKKKKRREKQLKLVLKLPSASSPTQKLEPDLDSEEDSKTTSLNRKRKINAIVDGSVSEKGDNKSVSGANPSNNNVQDLGPSTPLPDKKLLLFILDRLQKKDTYGVYSEPVDLEELPDYLEVIEHPMDFATVRKKLSSGVYANLEQFERDIFLICSNAMQYNAPDTIYFRQARAIQELAVKSFENLRQDSDDNEPEPTVVRRGRPPTKNLKKPLGRPALDRPGSECSLDATPATGGESTIWSNNDLRKGPHVSDKRGFADPSGRSHGSHNDSNWLADNKLEKNDEATGSMLKGNSMKYGKRQFAVYENRRNTYKQLPTNGWEPSVFTTFSSERKQLVAVGLLSEHGYARSLARFAANVGTVAWKIASKRIERSLPPGIKFGPGWVGENDIPPQRALVLSSPPPGPLSSSHPLSLPINTAATSSIAVPKEKLSQKRENNMTQNDMPPIQSASEGHLSNSLSPSASSSTSPVVASKSEPCTERAEAVERLNSHSGFNVLDSNCSIMRLRPPFQVHQIHPGMNGFNGTRGFNHPAQMEKLVGFSRPPGFNFQSSQMVKTNAKFVHLARMNSLTSEIPKLLDNSGAINPTGATSNPGNEEMEVPKSGFEPQPSQQKSSHQPKSDSELSPQEKSDSVPPDLNVRFQSPGSPSSSRVDSVLAQPDLALQL